MSAIKAIFIKQLTDLPRNWSVFLLFVMWPLMAFVMGSLTGEAEVQTGMFVSMLIASGPMVSIANNVAEDNEYKGLRFLIMAGVKPWQYLISMASAFILASVVSLIALFWIGGFTGDILFRSSIAAALGLVTSALLGAAIGIFAKNVQQATAVSTPLMMVLAFAPMVSMLNETIARISEFLFSTQVLILVLDPNANFTRALIIIMANAAILLAFFVVAYKKKGLRGG